MGDIIQVMIITTSLPRQINNVQKIAQFSHLGFHM